MQTLKKETTRVRVFQHTPAEPLGYLETIFTEEGIPYEHVQSVER